MGGFVLSGCRSVEISRPQNGGKSHKRIGTVTVTSRSCTCCRKTLLETRVKTMYFCYLILPGQRKMFYHGNLAIWPGCLRVFPPPEAGLDRGQDVRSVSTLSQMQPLTGALACGKGHLQSISLERKLCFGLCHCGWLKVRRSPLFLRLSSVTVKKVSQIGVEQNATAWLVRRSVFMIHLTLTGLARTLQRESVLL
ncbi:hypothetical protein PO909_030712 [Leuciscus waleckii]